MKHSELIIFVLRKAIPEDCDGILTDIEFYTREPGFGIQGDGLNIGGQFIKYINYGEGISNDLSEIIYAWNADTLTTLARWNKARFVVYRDGREEFNFWWDEEFQKKLYRDA